MRTYKEAKGRERTLKAFILRQQNGNSGHMQKKLRVKCCNRATRPALRFVVNFKESGRRARRFFVTKREA